VLVIFAAMSLGTNSWSRVSGVNTPELVAR
jgi:hypothetical protein